MSCRSTSQLYERIRDAITRGALRPGERVPPVRGLAGELSVARGTVELAYQLLTSEGYLQARGPAGTVVSPQLAGRTAAAPAVMVAPDTVERALPGLIAHGPALRPFQLGLPALNAWCVEARREPALIMSFTNITDEQVAARLAPLLG